MGFWDSLYTRLVSACGVKCEVTLCLLLHARIIKIALCEFWYFYMKQEYVIIIYILQYGAKGKKININFAVIYGSDRLILHGDFQAFSV